jgi:uncharacterized RDD family membrane protein YckC
MPMLSVMNATAQASAAPVTGPKLDNRRVLAALVDLAIVVAGTLVILFAGDALSGDSGDVRGALTAVILGWALYYYFALESGDGQTVGKKLLKLRVVRADGSPAGMREIAVRTVLRVVDGVGAYIVGLIVMLATGQRRQRLGDLAAGTIVVDASAAAYWPSAPVVEPVADAPVEDEADAETTSYTDPPTISLPSRSPAPTTLADLASPEAPPVPEMRPFDPPAAEPVVEDEPEVQDEPVADYDALAEEPVAEVELDEPVAAVEVDVVEDEPLEAEPMIEAVEPLEVEPVAEVELEVVEENPVVEVVAPLEDELDEPVEPVAEVAVVEEEPVEAAPVIEVVAPLEVELDEPVEPVAEVDVDVVDDEEVTVKSVETVSAIDLVMGGAPEEDGSSDEDQDLQPPAAS